MLGPLYVFPVGPWGRVQAASPTMHLSTMLEIQVKRATDSNMKVSNKFQNPKLSQKEATAKDASNQKPGSLNSKPQTPNVGVLIIRIGF